MIQASDPVAGYGGILAGGLAQQPPQGIQTILGNGRLPGAVAAALCELVNDAAGFFQCALVALRYQQNIHVVPQPCVWPDGDVSEAACAASLPVRSATSLTVSIMKSRASVRVSVSMQC